MAEPQTRKPETLAFAETMNELPLWRGIILTPNKEEQIEVESGKFGMLPALRFLLNFPDSACIQALRPFPGPPKSDILLPLAYKWNNLAGLNQVWVGEQRLDCLSSLRSWGEPPSSLGFPGSISLIWQRGFFCHGMLLLLGGGIGPPSTPSSRKTESAFSSLLW